MASANQDGSRNNRPSPRLKAAALVGVSLASAAAWAQEATSDTQGPPTAPAETAAPVAGAMPGPTPTFMLSGLAVNLGVTLSQTFTGNGNQGSGNNREAVFTTSLSPYASISGDTGRTQMSLYYQPSFNYATNTDPAFSMYHNLNGRMHTTVVEDLFYIDAYAYASVVPQYAGFRLDNPAIGPNGQPIPSANAGLSSRNLSQYYSFSVTPALTRTFGGTGTATASVSFTETGSSAPNYQNTQNGFQNINPRGQTQTLSETLSFVTGEDLGRFQNTTRLYASQATGTGVSGRSSSMDARNTLSYAVTRWATVMGQAGYQKYDFPNAVVVTNDQTQATSRRYSLESVVWNVGAKFIPNADSQITIGYGRLYGGNQFNMDAYYQVTARTTLYATIFTGLGTGNGQVQNALFGNNGQPGPPPIGSAYLPGTQNVYRTKTASIGANTTLDQDAVSVSASASDQNVVATVANSDTVGTTPQPVQGNTRSYYVSASWTRQFSDVMNGGLSGSIGASRSPGVSSSTDVFASGRAYLSYMFSPTLSGSAQYYFYDLISQTPNRSYIQNVVMLSVTKQF